MYLKQFSVTGQSTTKTSTTTNPNIVVIEIRDAEVISLLKRQTITDFIKQLLTSGFCLSTPAVQQPFTHSHISTISLHIRQTQLSHIFTPRTLNSSTFLT